MSLLRTKWPWVFLLTAGSAALVGVWATPDDADPKHIADLIHQLGHPEYAKREAAGQELETVGEAALPALRKAAGTSDDPEIRQRAHGLAWAIMWGVRKSKSTDLEMIPIGTGTFLMGSPKVRGRQTDDPAHKVRITKPFLLGVYEVTQAEYRKVMKLSPSWFSADGGGKEKVKGEDTDRFPVEQVTWFDALEFCNRLSKLDGFEPYYKMADVKREGDSIVAATVTLAGTNGYRLPTEAEWEYGCRARTTSLYHFGSVRTGKEANFKTVISGGYGGPDREVFVGHTTKVGSYPSNDWSLRDMHGNVAEWCWDWYDKDYYENAPETNPTGPDKGNQRVVRGGSWMLAYQNCRSASRYWLTPDEKKEHVGFRIARTP